jgi:hypothetical protein
MVMAALCHQLQRQQSRMALAQINNADAARPGGGGDGATNVDIDVDMDVDRNGSGHVGPQAQHIDVPNDALPPTSADEKHDNKSNLYDGVSPLKPNRQTPDSPGPTASFQWHVAIVFIAVLMLVYWIPN